MIKNIYNNIFKKILTLSNYIVIPIINDLFGARHSLDSEILYGTTVTVDGGLSEKISDSSLIVDRVYVYHMEAQRESDADIVYRTYDYSYRYAMTEGRGKENGRSVLRFPNSRVVYLYSSKKIPKEHILSLNYGEQGKFIYRAKTVPLIDYPPEEMRERGLVGFLPFLLLKMEEEMKKGCTDARIKNLQSLVNDDILKVLEEEYEEKNITWTDYISLQEAVWSLFWHLYGKYEEVRAMTETMEGVMKFQWEIIRDEGIKEGFSQGSDRVIQKMKQSGMSEEEIRAIVGDEMMEGKL